MTWGDMDQVLRWILLAFVAWTGHSLLSTLVAGWLSNMRDITEQLRAITSALPQVSHESERAMLSQVQLTENRILDEVQKTRHAVNNFHQAWLAAPERVEPGLIETGVGPASGFSTTIMPATRRPGEE